MAESQRASLGENHANQRRLPLRPDFLHRRDRSVPRDGLSLHRLPGPLGHALPNQRSRTDRFVPIFRARRRPTSRWRKAAIEGRRCSARSAERRCMRARWRTRPWSTFGLAASRSGRNSSQRCRYGSTRQCLGLQACPSCPDLQRSRLLWLPRRLGVVRIDERDGSGECRTSGRTWSEGGVAPRPW